MNILNVADDILIAIDTVEGNEDDGKQLTARQRERKAVKVMLQQLLGDVKLKHDKAGKPIVDGYNISISHTVNKLGGYAAIMISRAHEVGIDIEYVSHRIMKIADRFLRKDEKPQSVTDHLVCWCAKEAVYKLYSSDDLTYQQMRVNSEMTEVENLKRGLKVRISSIINDDFVLVYTYI